MNADRLAEMAWTQLWQMTLVIAAAGVVATLLCRNRPHWAYAVWMVALLKCVTPPVVTNPVGLFGATVTRNAAAAVAVDPGASTESPGSSERFVVAERFPTPAKSPRAAAGPATPAVSKQQSTVATPSLVRWPWVIAIVWAAGLLAVIGRAAMRSVSWRRRAVAAAVPTPAGVARVADEQRAALGLRRRPRVVVVDAAVGPAVVGVLRQVVVLPLSLADGRPTVLRAAITHEFLHLRRLDPLAAVVQALAIAAWWFHPLVWWAGRRASLAREMCCDAETVATLACDPVDYGQTLLDVARHARRETAGPLLAMTAATVGRRIEHLVTAGRFRRRASWPCRIGAVVLALLMLPAARPQRSASVAAGPTTAPATAPATMLTTIGDASASPVIVEPGGAIPAAGPITFVGYVRERSTGRPIAGATVTIYREETTGRLPSLSLKTLASPEEVVSDANGRYTFTLSAKHTATEKFVLATEVRHPQYAARNRKAAGLIGLRLAAAHGERPWFERIEMFPGATVTGRVVDPAGLPLADCAVVFRTSVGGDDRLAAQDNIEVSTSRKTTDANGRFTFNAIRDNATAKVTAVPANAAPQMWNVGGLHGDIGVMHLAAGQRVRGRVIDRAGGPVAGVDVRLISRSGQGVDAGRRTNTDADGGFDLPPAGPGEVTVFVGEGRFLTQRVQVGVNGPPPDLSIVEPEMVIVSGTIVDSSGKPVTDRRTANLLGSMPNEGFFVSGLRGKTEGGRFTLQAPKGLERVRISVINSQDRLKIWRRGDNGPWHASILSDLGPLKGDVTDLRIMELQEAGIIVRTVDPAGRPVKASKVSALYTERSLSRYGDDFERFGDDVTKLLPGDLDWTEQADGTWKSHGVLPLHELTLKVKAEGMSGSQTVTLKEGETREVTVTLKP